MDGREEQVRRLALKRRRKLGDLSDAGFKELELAVSGNPAAFVDDAQEQAFALYVRAIDAYQDAQRDDDLLDDKQFSIARSKRLAALHKACREALKRDPLCIDAMTTDALTQKLTTDVLLDRLFDINDLIEDAKGPLAVPPAGDARTDVFLRPRLRLQATIARTMLDAARYRLAVSTCTDLMTTSPLDALGARYTCALAMARLEDEEGLDWLDGRYNRHGNAWLHLSRAILLYKLDRMPAARRALLGFDRLCEGGAYALLQPVYVDTYIPDRPAFEPGSFEESLLATHEADGIIQDIPDFAGWANAQEAFSRSAHAFAEKNGYDWHGYDE